MSHNRCAVWPRHSLSSAMRSIPRARTATACTEPDVGLPRDYREHHACSHEWTVGKSSGFCAQRKKDVDDERGCCTQGQSERPDTRHRSGEKDRSDKRLTAAAALPMGMTSVLLTPALCVIQNP